MVSSASLHPKDLFTFKQPCACCFPREQHRSGRPESPLNKVTRLHAGLHSLAASVFEPFELFVCPVEEIFLNPATLGLRLSVVFLFSFASKWGPYRLMLFEILLEEGSGTVHHSKTSVFRTIRKLTQYVRRECKH